jgi:hypothetical protein
MKNINILNYFFVSIFALFFSCNDDTSVAEEKTETQMDTFVNTNTENAQLTVSIFFKTDDREDDEGNAYKGTVEERESFRIDKKYTYCYDSETFDHLLIEGTAEHIFFTVENSDSAIFKKEDFKIDKRIVFTGIDFDFNMGETHRIIVKQEDRIVFEGTIDSQGCM